MLFYCEPFTCHLSHKACVANQDLAYSALGALAWGRSLFELTDQMVNRVLICGECERSRIDHELSRRLLFLSLEPLADKLERFNEWGVDDWEITELKRRQVTRRYREKHKEEIQQRERAKITDKRIQKLKEMTHD